MRFHRFVLGAGNALLRLVVLVLVLTAGAYSAFALWDNQRIYLAAGNVRAQMQALRPEIGAGDRGISGFAELVRINPDVCGWLYMAGTRIDYPLVQGENNLSYINTDVYGEYALSGSIYLDSRCSAVFSDPYSLIYGHHMENHLMFGDLEQYQDPVFFAENHSGLLILPDRAYDLQAFACLITGASEKSVFEPGVWQSGNMTELYTFAENNSLCVNEDIIQRLRASDEPAQILCLSTCSEAFTDARTIVLAAMIPIPPST